jgi:hypothetical protein
MSYLHEERRLEQKWAGLLTADNVSQSMDYPANVNKLSSNWKVIAEGLNTDGLDFHSLDGLADRLMELCQSRKWFSKLADDEIISFKQDAKAYIAYLIWDIKRVNDDICSEKYWRLANMRHFSRCARRFGHEAVNHALHRFSGELSSQVIFELKQAFTQKIEELWAGESKPISLPEFRGDYLHGADGEGAA